MMRHALSDTYVQHSSARDMDDTLSLLLRAYVKFGAACGVWQLIQTRLLASC